ncbi:EpsD family peptidyl-prolyl cis-trans isomerase [Derxia lacustris]|uniref:EpsD family peptidyl-prolyl cis-trans isomerase n=1 Tax=Derxia lacustris TaxID=764842 RepID=UPI000A176E32|nr:EpsD family peptidyl-prolyl cis-trans isomerase [Derxia lacustris]
MIVETRVKNAMRCCASLIGILLLAACSKSGPPKAESSQVVATVNGTELTSHQLEFLIRRNPAAAANADNPVVARQALDKLVDDEIAAQKAISDGADKDERFIYASDSTRREILAQLAFEKLSSGIGKPSAEEVKTFYYETYPLMFKDRRVYFADELLLALPSIKVLESDLTSGSLSLDAAIRKLTSAQVEFRHEISAVRPEDIPLGTVSKLGSWTQRLPLVVPSPGFGRLLFLRSSEPVPIRFEDAKPRIERFIATQRLTETRQRLATQWRNDAKVTLAPKFNAVPAPAAAAPEPAAPAAPAAPAPAPASGEKKIDDAAIRKGIDSLR